MKDFIKEIKNVDTLKKRKEFLSNVLKAKFDTPEDEDVALQVLHQFFIASKDLERFKSLYTNAEYLKDMYRSMFENKCIIEFEEQTR